FLPMNKLLQKITEREPIVGLSTGLNFKLGSGKVFSIHSPTDGKLIGQVQAGTEQEYASLVKKAQEAFKIWREVPAPQRGDMVRKFRNKLAENKEDLGALVSYEM